MNSFIFFFTFTSFMMMFKDHTGVSSCFNPFSYAHAVQCSSSIAAGLHSSLWFSSLCGDWHSEWCVHALLGNSITRHFQETNDAAESNKNWFWLALCRSLCFLSFLGISFLLRALNGWKMNIKSQAGSHENHFVLMVIFLCLSELSMLWNDPSLQTSTVSLLMKCRL